MKYTFSLLHILCQINSLTYAIYIICIFLKYILYVYLTIYNGFIFMFFFLYFELKLLFVFKHNWISILYNYFKFKDPALLVVNYLFVNKDYYGNMRKLIPTHFLSLYICTTWPGISGTFTCYLRHTTLET